MNNEHLEKDQVVKSWKQKKVNLLVQEGKELALVQC